MVSIWCVKVESHGLKPWRCPFIVDFIHHNSILTPHVIADCKLGVCMTCPAKLVSGQVDQSGSMLSEDVAGKGYALLCVAQPLSDCKILTITEVRGKQQRKSPSGDL